MCLNVDLPENEDEFINLLDMYFPNYYDIRILSNSIDNLKGGLNKISIQLGIERFGTLHQAGSDSIVTGDVFFKLKFMNLISKEDILDRKNILFGIGRGADDDETYQYTMFSNDTININNNINGFNNVFFGNYYNNNNVNINDAKILQYIQKKGSFDSNHYNKYPWNMLVV